jgi:outer membrane immunogenic protein
MGVTMKHTSFGLCAGVILAIAAGQCASAADMALKAAPPPAPVASWTGIYVGVHAGAAWQSAPDWTAVDPNGVTAPATLTGNSVLGGVGGLQVGYNWQFAPTWVVGVEGDMSWASLADHRTQAPVFLAGGIPIPGSSLAMSANTQWLASARGKFGVVAWNTLFFVTGGAAWANIEYNSHGQSPGVGVTETTDFNTTTTKSGFVLGGGAEWMATTNVLIRAEYLYYNINAAQSGATPIVPPIVGVPLAPVDSWAKFNVQVARIAVSYKF